MIKEFAEHHMKTEQIKIDQELSQQVWKRGIRSPPRKIRVKMAKTEDGYVMVSPYEDESAKPKEEKAKKSDKKESKEVAPAEEKSEAPKAETKAEKPEPKAEKTAPKEKKADTKKPAKKPAKKSK
jgi:large subunit ribosomal protein L31e